MRRHIESVDFDRRRKHKPRRIEADGKAVLNVDLWEQLYELTKTHEVVFHKVAGHADNQFNNRCDELARAAIMELKKNLPPEDTQN